VWFRLTEEWTLHSTNQPTNQLPIKYGFSHVYWKFSCYLALSNRRQTMSVRSDGHTFIICYFIKYISVVTDIIDLLIIPSVLTHPRRTKVPNVTVRQSRFSSPDEFLHRYFPQVYSFQYIKPLYEFIYSYIAHW
jgi:hypothetical protein